MTSPAGAWPVANAAQALDHDRDAGQVVGGAPAVDAATLDDAGEGIVLPPLGARYRLAVGVGEEDQAAAAAGAREARHDALAFACIDRASAGELADHRHIAGPVTHPLHAAAERPRLSGDELLHCRFAVALRADQGLEEGDRVSHLFFAESAPLRDAS